MPNTGIATLAGEEEPLRLREAKTRGWGGFLPAQSPKGVMVDGRVCAELLRLLRENG